MSKVRIYDLAKEAGLKSKELADKLIAMGYPIASHSSSVDDDMAADIRKKLKGEAGAGAAEGRIELKNRKPEPVATGKTVIRRRSKADKDEAAKKQDEVEALALEVEIQALELRLQEESKAAKAQQAAKEAADARENARVEETAPDDAAIDREPIVAEQPSAEGQTIVPAEAVDDVETVAIASDGGEPIPLAVSKNAGEGEAQKPKQLARIVGRVVIPVPEKRNKPVMKKPVRRTTADPWRNTCCGPGGQGRCGSC